MIRFIIIAMLIASFSCKKTEIGPQYIGPDTVAVVIDTTSLADTAMMLFVVCEGNFGWGNASLSSYSPGSELVNSNVYQSVNGAPLGDVAQSAFSIDSLTYLCIDNSHKIVVINNRNFEEIGVISSINSPRYIIPIGNNLAYVSSIYSDQLTILNLSDNSILSSILLPGWTESMVRLDSDVAVINRDSNRVYKVNTTTHKITDSVDVGIEPGSVVVDDNGDLWVLCGGGIEEELAALFRINWSTFEVEQTFTFTDISDSPGNLVLGSNGTELFFLNGQVFKFNILDQHLPSSSLISNNGSLFYSLGIDPLSQDIYVSDAKDYVQNGEVYRYNLMGFPIDTISVGIIPGHFDFYEYN